MQAKLVIYLQANLNPCWAYVDADGRVKDVIYEGDPALLAEAVIHHEVIVLVPAEDVFVTVTQMPKMNRTRLLQAVPYALEEQLIDDVDETHVAIGERDEQGRLPVAVVSHEKMREWLALLASWQVQAERLLPASLALDGDEQNWHAGIINNTALVKTGRHQGLGCDEINFAALLDLAVQNATPTPQSIRISNASDHAFMNALSLPITIEEERVSPPQLLTELAYNAATQSFNLLQGNYALKKPKFPPLKKLWKVTSYLAIAWVVLLFLYPLISYFILSHRVSAIDAQIATIYKRHFPESRSVIAPKLRMEEKLNRLNAQLGANKAFTLLAYLGKGISATPSIVLKRLDFQNNQLTLELTAANSEDFSTFTDYLAQQGLNVKQQNADLNGAHVNATLVIE